MPDSLCGSALQGRHILMAEVIGPVPSVTDGLKVLATEEAIECATFDEISVARRPNPGTDALCEYGAQFMLATSDEEYALPEAYKGAPRCDRPIDLRT